jgi:nitrite reductase/ring-hydroxylating ferredoxin subunit
MPDVHVGPVSAFGDPGRKVIDAGSMEVGVFRLGEAFFAYENRCPHLEGPVCQGKILPLALEATAADGTSSGRVFSTERMNVVCPWHGFEFDIRTGEHPIDRRVRLRRLPVRVVDGDVYVTVPDAKSARGVHTAKSR